MFYTFLVGHIIPENVEYIGILTVVGLHHLNFFGLGQYRVPDNRIFRNSGVAAFHLPHPLLCGQLPAQVLRPGHIPYSGQHRHLPGNVQHIRAFSGPHSFQDIAAILICLILLAAGGGNVVLFKIQVVGVRQPVHLVPQTHGWEHNVPKIFVVKEGLLLLPHFLAQHLVAVVAAHGVNRKFRTRIGHQLEGILAFLRIFKMRRKSWIIFGYLRIGPLRDFSCLV